MAKQSKEMEAKDPLKVLNKVINRIHEKFLDMAISFTSEESTGYTRISYKEAIIRIKANKLLMTESVYMFSKEMGMTEDKLKEKLDSLESKSNLKFIPKLIRTEIIDENNEMPKLKDCVFKILSIFPDIKELLN